MFKQSLFAVALVGLVTGSQAYTHDTEISAVQKYTLIRLIEKQLDNASGLVSAAKLLTGICAAPGIVAGACLAVAPFLNNNPVNVEYAKDIFLLSTLASFISLFPLAKALADSNNLKREVVNLGLENEEALKPYLQ